MALPMPEGGFSRYGVTLTPIAEDELEMVRGWRNDPKIASQMIDQTVITPEMQRAWFARLSASDRDLTCVARFRGGPIGVASLNRLDRDAGTCEPGMYIFEDAFRANLVPFCVAFALNDLAFEHFSMRRLLGKIYPSNTASIRFHEASGYIRVGGGGDDPLWRYELAYVPYVAARDRITRFIR